MNSKFKVGDTLQVIESTGPYSSLEKDLIIGSIVKVIDLETYFGSDNSDTYYYKVIPYEADSSDYTTFPWKGMLYYQFEFYITKEELKVQFPKEIKIVKRHLKSLKI